MTIRAIPRNLIVNALVEADLMDGEDGLKILHDYRRKFSGDDKACFGIVFYSFSDALRILVQLAFQLQAADSEYGDRLADDLAASGVLDGFVLYFPGWTVKD